MDAGVVYLWGAVGGFFAAGFVYVLPGVTQLAAAGDQGQRPRPAPTALLIAFLTAAAGLVPLIPETVTRGEAISLGLASQAIIKGLISGVRDALPPGATAQAGTVPAGPGGG